MTPREEMSLIYSMARSLLDDVCNYQNACVEHDEKHNGYDYRDYLGGDYSGSKVAIEHVIENGRAVLPDTNYLYFSRGKSSFGTDWIKIQDHWFGRER